MKNILTKLHKIMQEVDYIQKDKTNTFHRYNYASEQAIKEKLHAKLVEHGVLFSISVIGFTNATVKTAKGNEETLTTLNLAYSFTDIETAEVFAGEFVGSGQDSGDKGVYKAITGAIKYILTSTFLIPTGDDPEEETMEEKKPAKPVVKTDSRKEDIAKLLESMKEPVTVENIKKLTQLEAKPENFDEIISRLSAIKKERV